MKDSNRSPSYQIMLPSSESPDGSSTDENQVNIFRRIHNLLQGRYKWAILLGILGAAIGGYFGWSTSVPLYQSRGLLYVKPAIQSLTDPEGRQVTPMLSALVDSEVLFLKTDRVLGAAMKRETWLNLKRPVNEESLAKLRDSIGVIRPQRSLNILVSCLDEEPKAAKAVVASVIESYLELTASNNYQDLSKRLDSAERRKGLTQSQLDSKQKAILNRSLQYGSEEGIVRQEDAWLSMYTEHMAALRILKKRLKDLGAAEKPSVPKDDPGTGEGGSKQDPPGLEEQQELTPEEIAHEHQGMRDLILRRDGIVGEIEFMLDGEGLGENHSRVLAARRGLKVVNQQIERALEYFKTRPSIESTGSEAPATPLENLNRQIAHHKEYADLALESAKELGDHRVELEQLGLDATKLESQVEAASRLVRQLNSELNSQSRIVVQDPGSVANSPSEDPRMRACVMGAFVLGGLGVGIVILIAALDRRLKTSVDLATGMGQIRMLGLLPVIEKDMTDPVGADMARHAVHHIRALLQIDHSAEDGRTLCITGSAPEIGKTTLALALGYSFSASASRTLLIDCDFYGRGLSAHFNNLLQRRIESGIRKSRRTNGHGATGAPNTNGNGSAVSDVLDVFKGSQSVSPESVRHMLEEIAEGVSQGKGRDLGALENMIVLARQCIPLEHRDRRGTEFWDWLTETIGPYGAMDKAKLFGRLSRPAGLLNAMEGAALTDCVEKLDDHGLDLLPLGCGAERSASRISVSLILRLIAEAREQYQTVIVDTGPIPGSLGASIVAAQVDGTILLVNRGQDRSDVERAIGHLRGVQANIAGVVFNRAELKDALRVSASTSRRSGSRTEDGHLDG